MRGTLSLPVAMVAIQLRSLPCVGSGFRCAFACCSAAVWPRRVSSIIATMDEAGAVIRACRVAWGRPRSLRGSTSPRLPPLLPPRTPRRAGQRRSGRPGHGHRRRAPEASGAPGRRWLTRAPPTVDNGFRWKRVPRPQRVVAGSAQPGERRRSARSVAKSCAGRCARVRPQRRPANASHAAPTAATCCASGAAAEAQARVRAKNARVRSHASVAAAAS